MLTTFGEGERPGKPANARWPGFSDRLWSWRSIEQCWMNHSRFAISKRSPPTWAPLEHPSPTVPTGRPVLIPFLAVSRSRRWMLRRAVSSPPWLSCYAISCPCFIDCAFLFGPYVLHGGSKCPYYEYAVRMPCGVAIRRLCIGGELCNSCTRPPVGQLVLTQRADTHLGGCLGG